MTIFQTRETVEWTNTWIDDTGNLTGKRILLIGDSVSRHLRRPLSKAYGCPVDLIGCSSALNDPIFTNLIEYFFKDNCYHYNLIFVQLNHHGENSDYGAYGKQLSILCEQLQQKCPKVVLETLFDIYEERRINNALLRGMANYALRLGLIKERLNESRTDVCRRRNEEILKVGKALGLVTMDVQKMISDRHFIRIDHVHLEKKAYPYLASKIKETIQL